MVYGLLDHCHNEPLGCTSVPLRPSDFFHNTIRGTDGFVSECEEPVACLLFMICRTNGMPPPRKAKLPIVRARSLRLRYNGGQPDRPILTVDGLDPPIPWLR